MTNRFSDEVFAQNVLMRTDTPGIVIRSAKFEIVVCALRRYIRQLDDKISEELHVPPVMGRFDLERSGFLAAFPQLSGVVSVFRGNEVDHRKLLASLELSEDWTSILTGSEVVLVPAACYPIYPLLSRRGRFPSTGTYLDIECQCFRCEPSPDAFRLQSFRQHEFVCVGSVETAEAHRQSWIKKGLLLAAELGLQSDIRAAQDAFFGRGGQLLTSRQDENALKYELQVHIPGRGEPVACASFNLHQDKFGRAFNIRLDCDAPASSACVGFGLERLALAIYAVHGFDSKQWPTAVQHLIEPTI